MLRRDEEETNDNIPHRTFIELHLDNRSIKMLKPFESEEMERFFEEQTKIKIRTLESLYPDRYKPTIHDNMVISLVKSEMLIDEYEYLLLNHMESETIMKLIRDERANRNFFYSELILGLKTKAKMKEFKEDGTVSLFDLQNHHSLYSHDDEEEDSL